MIVRVTKPLERLVPATWTRVGFRARKATRELKSEVLLSDAEGLSTLHIGPGHAMVIRLKANGVMGYINHEYIEDRIMTVIGSVFHPVHFA